MDRLIGEIIRVVDTQEKEHEYMREKFKEKIEIIDIEVRAIFDSRAITYTLKITNRFNYYRARHIRVNSIGTSNRCLQCT